MATPAPCAGGRPASLMPSGTRRNRGRSGPGTQVRCMRDSRPGAAAPQVSAARPLKLITRCCRARSGPRWTATTSRTPMRLSLIFLPMFMVLPRPDEPVVMIISTNRRYRQNLLLICSYTASTRCGSVVYGPDGIRLFLASEAGTGLALVCGLRLSARCQNRRRRATRAQARWPRRRALGGGTDSPAPPTRPLARRSVVTVASPSISAATGSPSSISRCSRTAARRHPRAGSAMASSPT